MRVRGNEIDSARVISVAAYAGSQAARRGAARVQQRTGGTRAGAFNNRLDAGLTIFLAAQVVVVVLAPFAGQDGTRRH